MGPLIAISASASILELAKRNRAGKIAAVMIVAGLIIVWAVRYRADLQTFLFPGRPLALALVFEDPNPTPLLPNQREVPTFFEERVVHL